MHTLTRSNALDFAVTLIVSQPLKLGQSLSPPGLLHLFEMTQVHVLRKQC